MRSTLVWGQVVLLLACGASHRGSGSGDGTHETSGGDAGSGGATTTIPGNGGSTSRSGAGGNGGALAGGSSTGGKSASQGGAGGGVGLAGTGANSRAGMSGAGAGGGSGGATAGMSGVAGTIDGSWRLSELHGDKKYLSATVYSISGDGTYVSGSATDGGVERGTRWENDAITVFDMPAAWTYGYGLSISEDGSKVVGYATSSDYGVAFIWDGSGTQVLPGLEPAMQSGSNATAIAISGDGHVVVGTSTPQGQTTNVVRWTDGALDTLPVPDGVRDARPRSVNRDGSVIAGSGQVTYTTGLRWTDGNAESFGQDSVQIHDVSADGRWIVGSESTIDLDTGARPTRAVRYGPNGAEYLPDPDGRGWNCDAVAVSGDGSIVIGTCSEPVGNVTHPYAFLFSPERGSVPLDTVLKAVGVDLSAYTPFSLVDISSDGTTLLARYASPTSAGLKIKITGAFP